MRVEACYRFGSWESFVVVVGFRIMVEVVWAARERAVLGGRVAGGGLEVEGRFFGLGGA